MRAPVKPLPIPKSPASPSLLAYLIVSKFADHLPLYRIDKRLERLGLALPQPLLLELKTWLEHQLDAALPKSALGKAIRYVLKNWTALYRYSTTGHLNIDNNLAEQSMRPIALGRKNFLFVGSEAAGRNAAVLYSLVETCKVNHINPLSYLTELLEKLPELGRPPKMEDLQSLLPYTERNLKQHRLG